jgi:hypothetical protein
MKSLGKIIDSVRLGEDDALHFEFLDCDTLKISDDGQSCCERRYMTTDDNLQDYVGATFLGIELKEAPDIEDEYGEHEVLFLEIKTSKGCFTMATHNEHNGYYSGFSIRMTENE